MLLNDINATAHTQLIEKPYQLQVQIVFPLSLLNQPNTRCILSLFQNSNIIAFTIAFCFEVDHLQNQHNGMLLPFVQVYLRESRMNFKISHSNFSNYMTHLIKL